MVVLVVAAVVVVVVVMVVVIRATVLLPLPSPVRPLNVVGEPRWSRSGPRRSLALDSESLHGFRTKVWG